MTTQQTISISIIGLAVITMLIFCVPEPFYSVPLGIGQACGFVSGLSLARVVGWQNAKKDKQNAAIYSN